MALIEAEIDQILDAIGTKLANKKTSLSANKARFTTDYNDLLSFPTTYAVVITAIGDLDSDSASNLERKARLADYVENYKTLRDASSAAVSGLENITDF